MSVILDHTHDLSGTETHRLTQLYPPPEFVKQASRAQLYGPEDSSTQPAHLYADPRKQNYPCHSKAATWMSALFFLEKGTQYKTAEAQAIGQRLEKSAEYFQMRPELDQLKRAMAADSGDDLAKLPDADFALVWASEQGKDRHYPLRNAQEVKMASEWFTQYRDQFVFADRHTMADKICTKAAEYHVALDDPELFQKTAGYGHCAADTIAQALEKRANLVARKYPEYTAEMRKIAASVRENPPGARDTGMRIKLATLIDQFDRQTQLTSLYHEGGLEMPEEILFQITEKVAHDFATQHFSTTNGAFYEKTAMEQLTPDQVREWMGDDFADEVASGLYVDVAKMATIAATLPRGDAEVFERMCASLDIQPFARDKAASASGISQAELFALAQQYDNDATPAAASVL